MKGGHKISLQIKQIVNQLDCMGYNMQQALNQCCVEWFSIEILNYGVVNLILCCSTKLCQSWGKTIWKKNSLDQIATMGWWWKNIFYSLQAFNTK